MTRVIADTQRHTGHADILRELIDGAVGMNERNTAIPTGDPEWWEKHRDRLERVARQASSSE